MTIMLYVTYTPSKGDLLSSVERDLLLDHEITEAAGVERVGSGYDMVALRREIDFEYATEGDALEAQSRVIRALVARDVDHTTQAIRLVDDDTVDPTPSSQ